jgi:hypothetical protein
MTDTLIGHNNPPAEIAEIVREAQQARDLRDAAKEAEDKAKAPWLHRAAEAAAPHRKEWEQHNGHYTNLSSQVGKWQAKQRTANPFADPKEVSRIIIDGEVAATIRTTESFEIIKADMVPREFCEPSDAKIKAALALGKEVPGVAKAQKHSVVIR